MLSAALVLMVVGVGAVERPIVRPLHCNGRGWRRRRRSPRSFRYPVGVWDTCPPVRPVRLWRLFPDFGQTILRFTDRDCRYPRSLGTVPTMGLRPPR